MNAPGAGPTLDTDRLRLVPCGPDDVTRLHDLFLDADVRRYLLDDKLVERPWVEGVVEASVRSFAEAGFGLFRIETRADSGFAGVAGLRPSPGAVEPQLLYALDPAFWGRGLATEAASAVLDHAFGELGFVEVLASTDPPNRASMRVMERLGMRFLEAGRVGDLPIVFYRVTRAGWERRRKTSR